jgi:hypothetical protein
VALDSAEDGVPIVGGLVFGRVYLSGRIIEADVRTPREQ